MSFVATEHPTAKVSLPTTRRDPPQWLLISLAVILLGALAALFLAPGGTAIDRLRVLVSGICAQLPTHSFYPGGVQLPLCARNTGIYLSFSLSVITLVARGYGRSARLPGRWVACVLLLGIGAMALDGFNSLFLDLGLPHLYQPQNLLRLATGLLAGTAMAAFLAPVANGVIWRRLDVRAAFPSLWPIVWMLPVLLIAFGAVASQWSALLYPIALLSTAGVVLVLTLINLTFVLVFSGSARRFERLPQVAPVFALAMGLAVIELIGLSYAKFFLG